MVAEEIKNQEKKSEQDMKWYIIHTYSGYENKVKQALEERIKAYNKEDMISEIFIPSEKIIDLVKGKKKVTMKNFYPGYVFIKMKLTNETWHIVRSTPRVTGFLGDGKEPIPVPEEEMKAIMEQTTEGLKPKMKSVFEKGDTVKVIDGPFANFVGVVSEVKPDRGKLRVLVSVFGRSTPVELDFFQVQKI